MESPAKAASADYVPALDGLRGLAIAAVIVTHVGELWQVTFHSKLGHAVAKMAETGWCGVDLFFVLSGYLITGILVDTRGRSAYFKSFYARRTLRIFPLYYAFLALLIAAAFFVWPGVMKWHEVDDHLAWYVMYLENWHFAFDGLPQLATVTHLWSLAVEEQFYLLWPAVVAICAPPRLRWVALAGIVCVWGLRGVLILEGSEPLPIYVCTATRLDAILMGSLLALAMRDGVMAEMVRTRAKRVVIGVAIALSVLVLARRGLISGDLWIQGLGFAGLAVFFAGILAMTITGQLPGVLAKPMASPMLRRAGKISYGAYVFHWPITLLVRQYWVPPAGLPDAEVFAGALFLTVGATWIVAELSFRYFETPLLALKARFPRPGEPVTAGLQSQPMGSSSMTTSS